MVITKEIETPRLSWEDIPKFAQVQDICRKYLHFDYQGGWDNGGRTIGSTCQRCGKKGSTHVRTLRSVFSEWNEKDIFSILCDKCMEERANEPCPICGGEMLEVSLDE